MRVSATRSLALIVAVAAHVAVLVPTWWSHDSLAGGIGGEVSDGKSMTISLAQAPKKKAASQASKAPEPEPDAVKTEQTEKAEEEEQAEKEEPQEPEQEEARDNEEQEARQAKRRIGDGQQAGRGADTTGHNDNAWNLYLGKLHRAIENRKSYPRRARMMRQQGTVMVRFVMDEQGRVQQVAIRKSSGSELLDEHVTRMLAGMSLPTPPPELEVAGEPITLPVSFSLN
jgi:protein TonB